MPEHRATESHNDWTTTTGSPQTARQQLLLALAVAEFVGMLAIAVVVAKLSRQAIRPLATALAIQRRFVDDASHELRARVTDTGD